MKLELTLKEFAYITKLVGGQTGLDKEKILRDSVTHPHESTEDMILSNATYKDLDKDLYIRLVDVVEHAMDNRSTEYKVLYKVGNEFLVTTEYYSSEEDYCHNKKMHGHFIQLIKESERCEFSDVEIELVG